MLAIETVAVLGCGDAAHACAILSALSGCAVRFHDPSTEVLDRSFEAIRFRVDVAIERGLLTRSDRQRILDGILVTPDLEEAVTAADLVIEQGRAARGSRLLDAAGLVRATAPLAAPDLAAAAAVAGAIAQPGRVLVMEADRSSGFTRLRVLAVPHTTSHALAGAERFAERANARGRHEP